MKIIFVRHGKPDYANDTLTDLGHAQAEAVAISLSAMGIEGIYSSSHGRAVQTAEHTAKKLSLDIQKCDFIREITANPKDPECKYGIEYSPWRRSHQYKCRNMPITDPMWKNCDLFTDIDTPESVEKIGEGVDGWLASLGLVRDGFYYRI